MKTYYRDFKMWIPLKETSSKIGFLMMDIENSLLSFSEASKDTYFCSQTFNRQYEIVISHHTELSKIFELIFNMTNAEARHQLNKFNMYINK
jgi:hypothetical protein